MNRRDFATGLGGIALAWPLVVSAQAPDRPRRIGVLMGYSERDPEAQTHLAAFKAELTSLGWKEGDKLRIDVRWAGGDPERALVIARDLVTLKPDVIVSNTTPVTAVLKRVDQTIPTVFVVVSDPVGSGFVRTLAHPETNMTGFTNLDSPLGEKWLQLLKEIAPHVKRVAVMFNPKTAPYAEFYLERITVAAPKLGVSLVLARVGSEAHIERAIADIAREPDGGLLCMTDSFLFVHRKRIVESAAQHKVPAIYSAIAQVVEDGGLIAYGVNVKDIFRRAASYVDQILRGARPKDLPVQAPTKFEMAVNKKTAEALGLTIPPLILLRADRVVE